jgi:hypothetical protein
MSISIIMCACMYLSIPYLPISSSSSWFCFSGEPWLTQAGTRIGQRTHCLQGPAENEYSSFHEYCYCHNDSLINTCPFFTLRRRYQAVGPQSGHFFWENLWHEKTAFLGLSCSAQGLPQGWKSKVLDRHSKKPPCWDYPRLASYWVTWL